MLKIDVISVQPQMLKGFLEESILARAVKKGACEINIIDLKDYGIGRWKKTDDKPYGGGPGMLMRCEPWFAAVEDELKIENGELRIENGKIVGLPDGVRIIMTSPKGRRWTQRDAEHFAKLAIASDTRSLSLAPCPQKRLIDGATGLQNVGATGQHLIFLCGHYEGFDARIETLATDFYSLGDFVMTGGELAAAAMIDSIVRLLPGVLGGGPAATASESFGAEGLLECPQYTHPEDFRGMKVPEVLLSGDHAKIEQWRMAQAKELTARLRSDLIK